MHALLVTLWLSLPLAPYNPIEQDTLPSISAHFTAGLTSPNGIVSLGPELSSKFEMLVVHPFLVRGALDLNYGKTVSALYPQGDLYSLTMAGDALYYRGTNHLMGYVGIGFVYTFYHFSASRASMDSLFAEERVVDVDVDKALGYRLTLGLRMHRSYSLELGITEIRPEFLLQADEGNGTISRWRKSTRTSSFRLTFGYLLPLRKF
ncbi:MAG: hypothetical protein KKA42_03290 [candidate division Zixibacteria bacterium]|nr:hypothetical protein [candidate division Zixibacteria bacterium]